MSPEHATADRPLHPLAEMTTSELAGYRRNLEREISRLSQDARAQLQTRLDDVLAEEDDRARIRAGIG